MWKLKTKEIFFLFFFLFPSLCKSQSVELLNQAITNWLTSPELTHSSIGLCFKDAGTGKIIAETTPQLSLVPGSILKLATTATALEMLGPYFRFETQLAYDGEIKNDTLHGNLIIIGGGDPALGSKYFKEFYLHPHFLDECVYNLQENHISHITGNIVADVSIYETQMVPNTWIWEDLGNYYGAGACGLSVYDNLYKIHLSSQNEAGLPTKITDIEPEIPGIKIENNVLSSNVNSDLAYIFGSPLDSKRLIRGTIPKGKSDFVIKASIPNPPLLLVNQLKEKAIQSGISIDGKIIVQTDRKAVDVTNSLSNILSPPLIDIIRVTNYESVNLFAEHMLKHLAYMETGIGSTKEGIKIVEQFWKEKGINLQGLFLVDGSGLSRFNGITAHQMVEILSYMDNTSSYSDLFFSSIPNVPNGTLYVFDQKNFPKGCLQAKSGSMTRVRSYAGIIQTTYGKRVLFTVMLNNFSCSQAKAIDLIEELLLKVRTSN